MKWRIFELFFCLTWIPFLESDPIKDTNVDSPPGTVITNEFCGYERFLARCNPREVILVRNASFGRMRAGKCVTGDYSHAIGCSSDVTSHVSNMCTGRQNCSFLVAMMDSVAQPCAKDFKSYLEASYVCHKAHFVEKNCGDNSVVLTKTDWSGYLAFYWRHLLLNPPLEFGSICTWKFTVEDGRRIEMSWIKTFQDIPPVKPTPLPRQRNLSLVSQSFFKPNLRCPVKMWVSESSDNEVSVSACQDLSNRQRTFYTSLGNKMLLKIRMELSAKDEVVSFYVSRPNEVLPWQNKLLHFKVVGCPKVEQSGDHTTWQHGDSAAVVCASSGKTWYLSCRDGKWIGFVGNCSKADHKKLVSAEASNMGPSELSNGAVMAVLVGVVTGFAIGMLLLFAIVFTKRSYRRGRTQERSHKKLDMISHGHGNNYFTMTNTPSNSIRLRDSFSFKEREDCLQTINDVKENNNNNNNNNNGRLIHHKTPSDILAPLPKTATPSPLFQYSQTAYSVSPASEPTKRRSGSYCIHRQYPNLPDFLSTCNSPECIECCLCSNADNFLISVSSHGEDFHNFANAMENLCNHNGDLESQSFLPCSKKDMAEEAHCSPSLFVPLEKVRLLSHPKHGCFGRNCQLSICTRPSPSHRSSYETCDCSSAASPRVKQITSSGHNSQCILLQDAEDVKGQENCGNKSKEEAKSGSEEVSCLKTSLVDG